ncbi:CDP-diacylglycerol--glycerol-3-phosphate 3-phosphatidyltransferase [Patescibacteria group bacterium]|nr:CDP-diacylglycerol--glycerol-3-phosphate 3-phosphatidyltransferase [Patescibacteria group bacterium]
MKINVATALTLSRFVMLPIILLLIRAGGRTYLVTASIIMLISEITDILDGRVARRIGLVSEEGKLLDPLADSICHSSVFILMAGIGWIPAWATIIVVARELAVGTLRNLAAARGVALAARLSGKVKTVVYAIVQIALVVSHITADFLPSIPEVFRFINWGLGLIAIALAIFSGLDYGTHVLRRFRIKRMG